MINRKFLHFNTEAAFEDAKNAIPYESIVFIKDTRKIYTHGAFYFGSSEKKLDSGIKWSNRTVTVLLGLESTFPQLLNPNNLPVTYYSSDETIAEIDSEGFITLKNKKGDVVITVTFAGNDQYDSVSDSCTIKVKKQVPNIRWSNDSATVTLGANNNSFPTIVNASGLLTTWSFSSSNEAVATIAPVSTTNPGECQVNLIGAGNTTISVNTEETDIYEAFEAKYTLRVLMAEAELGWSVASFNVRIGDTNVNWPTLNKPNNVNVRYESSNTSVATVDPITGIVNLVGVGSAAISAIVENDPIYGNTRTAYGLIVKGKISNISYNKSNVSVTFGVTPYNLPTIQNRSNEQLSFTSDDTSVATVDSNGVVTIKSVGGPVRIKATVTNTNIYESKQVYYDLTVNSQPKEDPELEWDSFTYTVYIDDDINNDSNRPQLDMTSGITVHYSSSKTSVASINSDTGAITLLGSGTTTIKATSVATETYNSVSASYTLIVNKHTSNISWSKSSVTVTLNGDYTGLPELNNIVDELITYSSTNASIASIDQYGAVSIHSTGTVTIKATVSNTNLYNTKTVTYTLTVNPTPKQNPNLSWSSNNAYVTYGSTPYTLPTLSKPSDINTISYSISNTTVATINSSTGALTIKNATGTATVTANFAGNSTYNSGQASYTLHVTAQSQPEPSETFNVGYGYFVPGSSFSTMNVRQNVTTVAGDYTITIPEVFYGTPVVGAMLYFEVPKKQDGNEITKIIYNPDGFGEDITSDFERIDKPGDYTRVYYKTKTDPNHPDDPDNLFVPGNHKLRVS